MEPIAHRERERLLLGRVEQGVMVQLLPRISMTLGRAPIFIDTLRLSGRQASPGTGVSPASGLDWHSREPTYAAEAKIEPIKS